MKSTFRYACLFFGLLFSITFVHAQTVLEKKVYSMPWTDQGYQNLTPLLRVTLSDGIPRLFALDTGAPTTIIASDVARMLKLPVRTRKFTTPGKTGEFEYIISPASLGPGVLPLSEVPFALMDMSVVREADPDMAGILGTNVLQFFALRLDFQKCQVDFLYVEKIEGTEWEPKEAMRIPLIYTNEGYCFVDGELNGKPVRFVLDTGAPYTFLSNRSLLFSLKPGAKLEGFLNAAATDEGTKMKAVPARKLRLQSLKIGGAEWKEPVVEEMSESGEDQINALGVDFLRRFRVIVDFPGRMLYLTPDPAFKPEEREWFGIGLELWINAQKRVIVARVLKPSPAYSAKVKENEEVIEIDGQPVPNGTTEELTKWWRKKQSESEEISLKLQKPGTDKTRTLKLKVKKLL